MAKRELTILAAAALLTLTACAKKDVILPGEREDIRAVLDDAGESAGTIINQPVLGEEAVGTAVNRAMAISLPAATVNANWTQSPASPFVRTAHPALRATPQLIWSANIGSGDGQRVRITADPVVAGGLIFTQDATSQVTAVSSDGKVLWTRDLTPPYERSRDASGGGLAYGDNLLLVTTGFGVLTALNPADGGIVWQQKLGASTTGAPSVRDGIVYLVSGDDIAWAIEATTGRVLWQLSSTPDINNVLRAPAPALSDKYVVFGFGLGELQGAFRKGGLRMWDAQIAGERLGISAALVNDVTGDPIIDGSRIYSGTHSGRTVALGLADGERLWTTNIGATSPIWPVGGSLFFVSDRNQLIRLSAETGERIWGVRLPSFTKSKPRRQSEIYEQHGPIVAGGQVVVASGDGKLRLFDPVNGGLRYETDLPGGATTNPVIAGGTLYVVTSKGQLLAYR